MPTAAAVTIAYMIEPLPTNYQDQLVDHLRGYIEDMREDIQWNESFAKSQDRLIAIAKEARSSVKQDKASIMDISRL